MHVTNNGLLGRLLAPFVKNRRLANGQWEALVPAALILLLGGGLAALIALLIVREEWLFILPAIVAIPAAVLLLRYPFVAVAIWLLVFPLVVETPSGTRQLQWLLHRAMIPAALALVVLARGLRLRRHRPLRLGPAEAAMLLYLFLSIGNILLMSQTPAAMLIHYYDRIVIPFCMYALIRALDLQPRALKWLVPVALAVIIIQLAIGLLSWVSPGLLPNAWLGRAGARTTGSLGIPGVYTGTLLFLALLLLQYGLGSRSSRILAGTAVVFVAVMFAVFFSFSRGSWLGALAVIGGLGFLYPRVISRVVLITVLFLVLLGGTIFIDEISFAAERLTTERTAGARIVGNAATIRLIEQKPLFGWGYGNHELYDEQFRERIWDIPVRRDITSHHTYLLVASEMGLVGLFLYLLPAGWWLVQSVRAWSRLPRSGFGGRSWLVMLWLVLLNFFIIANFTDIIYSYYFPTTIWWLALGLIASLVSQAPEREQAASLQSASAARLSPLSNGFSAEDTTFDLPPDRRQA